MTAFETLKDVCTAFDTGLKLLNKDLFCAKVGESSEEVIARKLKDLALYNSKYKLLHAKETAFTPEVNEKVQNKAETLSRLEEAVQNKVLEQMIVKTVSTNRHIQILLTTEDKKLDQVLVERKRKIKESLERMRRVDSELRQLDAVLAEKNREHKHVRQQWDVILGELRDMKNEDVPDGGIEASGKYYDKLKNYVTKIELARTLLTGVFLSGAGYDWIGDHRKLYDRMKRAAGEKTMMDYLDDDYDDEMVE